MEEDPSRAKRHYFQRSLLLGIPFALAYVPMLFGAQNFVTDTVGVFLFVWILCRILPAKAEALESFSYKRAFAETVVLCVGAMALLILSVTSIVIRSLAPILFAMPLIWVAFWLWVVARGFRLIDQGAM